MIKQSNGEITTFFEHTNQGTHSTMSEWIELATNEIRKVMPDYDEKRKQYKTIVTKLGEHIVVTFDDPFRDPSSLGGSGTDLPTFEVTIDPVSKKVIKAHFSR